jgi:hypothetical protein
MIALDASSSREAKPATSRTNKSKPNTKPAKSSATPAKQAKADASARSTKQDRILSLLNQRNGATIPELMRATDWQQHSVRGFLAGTVKKKLGLALTSSKSDGELRRYRLETRRGR